MNCDECGKKIKKYHPHANYERITMSTEKGESGVEEKKLCQVCATAVADELAKYQPGKLYIE